MAIDRRELFTIVGAGVAATGTASAQHEHRTPATPLGPYDPRVLSKAQYETLNRLLEILLPADDHSASAKDAGVARYIDTTLKYGDDRLRNAWLAGLEAIDRLAQDQHQRVFLKLSDAEANELLSKLAAAEEHPAAPAERFFPLFKQQAISAYYLSDQGRRSLGYRGDTAISSFPGCTHPGHHQA
jgi:hypothetical protein